MHTQPTLGTTSIWQVLSYYRFDTADASMAISDKHWLIVNGVETDPAHVKVPRLHQSR